MWCTFLDLFFDIKIKPTPLKFDVDSKNETLEDVSPLAIWLFGVPVWNFRRVSKCIGQVFSKGIELINIPPLRIFFGPTCISCQKIPKGDLGFRRFSKPRTLILHHMIELTDGKSLLSQRKIDLLNFDWRHQPPMHMNFEPHELVLYFLSRLVSKTLIGLKFVDGTSTANCTPSLLVIQPSPPPKEKPASTLSSFQPTISLWCHPPLWLKVLDVIPSQRLAVQGACQVT